MAQCTIDLENPYFKKALKKTGDPDAALAALGHVKDRIEGITLNAIWYPKGFSVTRNTPTTTTRYGGTTGHLKGSPPRDVKRGA
jgi:hypothetical protein